MDWRVEIKEKEGVFDAFGEQLRRDITDLGINTVKDVKVVYVYFISGAISKEEIRTVCATLLSDPIVQDYTFSPVSSSHSLRTAKNFKVVEIAYNPGVMDPVAESTVKGIHDLGISVETVRTARKYLFKGPVTDTQLKSITNKVLFNELIQHVVEDSAGEQQRLPAGIDNDQFRVVEVDLLGRDDRQLMKLSQDGQLFLNKNEMRAIKKYFARLKRNPTDCELETIAQTWSEHCHHKTFRGDIRFFFKENGKTKKTLIRNLFKSTIARVTKKLDKDWCVSVFHDNAGIIKFDQDSHVCFKVETHNHPSALEPFGGANTGIGGVIRDSLGTGLGAKPICNTDVFCFAPPDTSFASLPKGTLHPKRIMKGVVSGVRDYGNKMGIPTVNGTIIFDEGFIGNPLVYCGNVGIIPKDKVKKGAKNGDLIVALGGKTGRDGIHGATFSSGELTDESQTISSGAVQIGDPIQEKKVMDALLKARDQNLYTAITDCGAGGFSSAVGEMGAKTGARVDLEKAPLKYQGLTYSEIWISESQERMVIAVAEENIEKLLKIFEKENVEATVIGKFTDTKRLELFFRGRQVCDLDMDFLHNGIPKITKEARFTSTKIRNPRLKCPADLTKELIGVLSHYNVCSKEWVVRQYDHEVQAMSVVKPLVGIADDGPSDASVLRPKPDSRKGIAVSNGINVRFGMIDPFWMAASCIEEALRQVVAVGGNPARVAILDNFCWGNPDKPDRLGSLVRAAQGCYKAALAYGVPFISGKDSLYNEFSDKRGKSTAIPGTLLISAIGIMEDVEKAVTMDFKEAGNLIYVIGETFDELGGSVYWERHGFLGNNVPVVDFIKGKKTLRAVSNAVKNGLAQSVHDCSQGGLGVALAEMAFSGGFGVTARLDQVPVNLKQRRNDTVLFSESNSRFLVEVSPKNKSAFEKNFKGLPFSMIGRVEATEEFIVYGLDQKVCVNTDIETLKKSWKETLSFS